MDIDPNSMEFQLLKKKISQLMDFKAEQYTDTFLIRRISTRLRALGEESLQNYKKTLENDSQERQKLEKELTIHVTHFFRDIPMWNAFKDTVIPLLIKNKKEKNDNKIRIWSAGSSTGEEAYSISICLHENLGGDLSGYDIKITGTDYDMKTIMKANEAVFLKEQFRETPSYILEKYFEKKDENTLSPVSNIKKICEFEKGDIVTMKKPLNLDIIFCRNTVIYFESKTKEKLYVDFFESLKNKGFFVMGKTETLLGPARNLFTVFDSQERIFKKE